MAKLNSTFFNSFDVDDDDDEKQGVKEQEQVEEDSIKEEEEDGDEIEEKEEDVVKDADEKEIDSEEEDTDFFTTIINDGADKGLFYFDEDKEYEGSGEDIFYEVINDTLNKRWQEDYVSQVPEEYQSLFAALKSGKSISDWMENALPVDYDSVDLSNEDNQRELIEKHLISTGMDEEDIKDTIQEYEDSGTLEKNSKKAVKYLKADESKKSSRYEKELEKEREEYDRLEEIEFTKFKNEVLSTEELGNRKLSKQEREKLFDHITKPVNKNGESQLVINQKSRDKQLQMAYLDMIGFDFGKIEKMAETKVAKGLRAKLSNVTDINTTRRGEGEKVATTSKRLPSGPWTSSSGDD